MKWFLFVLVSFFTSFSFVTPTKVTLYTQSNFKGINQTLNFSTCMKTPFDAIHSINTYDNCVHLYKSSTSCNSSFGNFLLVQPGMQHHDLGHYGYHSDVKSIGPCTRCFTLPQMDSVSWVNFKPQYHTESGWSPNPANLHANISVPSTCQNISQDVQNWGSVSSKITAFLPRNVCIEIYEGTNCNGPSTQLMSSSANRDTMNFLLHLKDVKSLSQCRENCSSSEQFTANNAMQFENAPKKISFIGKYRWERIMHIDNTKNQGIVKRTASIFTSIVCNYESLSHAIENEVSAIHGEGFSNGLHILKVEISGQLNSEARQMYESSIETKMYKKIESTLTDEYEAGPYSNMTVYQLVFDGPGISQATETISTTPIPTPNVNLTFHIKKTPVLSGISIIYTEDSVSRPSNHVPEARNGNPDINAGYGGKYVWLVPQFITDYSKGVTGLEIATDFSKNPLLSDLTEGSRLGSFKYLMFLNDSTQNVRISDVVLFRSSGSENANPAKFGWPNCTSNIYEDAVYQDFLYICWKTIFYRDPIPPTNNTLQVFGKYDWELMLNLDNTGNSGVMKRTKTVKTTTECSYNRMWKSVSESDRDGRLDVNLGGKFSIVDIGFKGSVNSQAKSSLESTVQNQSQTVEEITQTDEYEVGPDSQLILYRLIFTAPGINQRTSIISSTRDPMPDVPIDLTLQQTLVLTGIEVVYTKQSSLRPQNHIPDARYLPPDVNWGYNGNRVFLVPKWSSKPEDGVTGFEVVIQNEENPAHKNLAPVGSAPGKYGAFRYLIPVQSNQDNVRITRVALFRKKIGEKRGISEVEGDVWWDHCTSDINDGRSEIDVSEAVHLCWKTIPYEGRSESSFRYNFGGFISPFSNYTEPPLSLITRSFDDKASPVSALIVGGSAAGAGELPFQISLQLRDSHNKWNHLCGGVIVQEDKILTAAHCCEYIRKQSGGGRLPVSDRVRVVAGVVDISRPEAIPARQIIPVDKFEIHPDYNSVTMDNDICKLILSRELQKTPTVQKISLCRFEPRPTSCVASGWGNTRRVGNPVMPRFLQKVALPYVLRNVCGDEEHWDKTIHESKICAGGQGEKGICQGDSGGPLICNGCLAGLTSGNWPPCGTLNRPDMFANVAHFQNFINN